MGGWHSKCDLSSKDAQYLYCANGPAAVFFSVLFGLAWITHFIQAFMYKKKFCWVIIMAALWETAGLSLRTYSTIDQTQSNTTSASQLLVLLAPLWINAFVYMVFGRMVWYYLPERKIGPVKAEKMAQVFVWLDVSAFIVQATGGIMDSGFSDEADKIGLRIYTSGIAVQEFFVLCFLCMLIAFHRRMRKGLGNFERGAKWQTLVYTMYATLFLITVRIVYRLAEFANGGTSTPTVLSTQEAFFYVFEALPMVSALIIWNIWHPGRFLVGPESLFPKKVKISRKEKKALKEEKKATQQRESRKSRRERRSRSRRAEYAAPEVATAERPWIDEELQYTPHPHDPY